MFTNDKNDRQSAAFMLFAILLLAAVTLPGLSRADTLSEADPYAPLRSAWQQAQGGDKSVMLVLGAEWCDRCALLSRYMQDEALQQRIDQRFVVLHLDVGTPDAIIAMENHRVELPVIVLMDANDTFESLMRSQELLTFLPEPYEPIYDWFENVLFYSEHTLAVR